MRWALNHTIFQKVIRQNRPKRRIKKGVDPKGILIYRENSEIEILNQNPTVTD